MPDLSQVPVVGPALNAVGIGQPDQPAAPAAPAADTSAKREALAQLMAQGHKGLLGGSTALTTPIPAALIQKNSDGTPKATTQATGFHLYTFNDGSSIEINDNGDTQNFKQPASATKTATTPQEQLAAAGGPLVVPGSGGGVWTKQLGADGTPVTGADGKPVYVQTDASVASQQLADAKTKADTDYTNAQAAKDQADTAFNTDPTNITAKQNKAAADLAYTNTQAAQSAATTAKTQFDQQVEAAKLPGELAQQGATKAGTEATTTNTLATANKTTALLPTDVQSAQLAVQKAQQDLANNPADTAAKLALSDAQAKLALSTAAANTAKLNEPTLENTGTTAPTNTFWNPATNQFENRPNPAYTPTDPGRMTAQLQQQASAQQQTLQQQVAAGKLTSDQAASQFDQWWTTNIEPVKGDIVAAQAKAQAALDQQNAQTSYYNAQAANLPATLAQNASDQAQKNVISMMPYTTGKGFDQAFGQAMSSGWKGLTPQAVAGAATYSLPNLQEIGRQGAAAALANISPTAQMHLQTPGPPGQPPVPGMPSPTDLLSRSQYGNFGPPPGAPPAPAMPPTTAPTPPTPPTVPMGMTNPYYQQQYPGMGAGMPATGPVVGDMSGTGTNWSWPPYTPGG